MSVDSNNDSPHLRHRTGVVNMFGKNCEVKASEPKTAEALFLAHTAMNVTLQSQAPNSQAYGWTQVNQPRRFVYHGLQPPASTHLQVAQTIPPIYGGPAGQGGASIYSHSTITKTTAGPPGRDPEGAGIVYIQNNFYTLPPGAEAPRSANVTATPEFITQQQTHIIQSVGPSGLDNSSANAFTYGTQQAALANQGY